MKITTGALFAVLGAVSGLTLYRAYQVDGMAGIEIPLILGVAVAFIYGSFAEIHRNRIKRGIWLNFSAILVLAGYAELSISTYTTYDLPGHLVAGAVAVVVGLLIITVGLGRLRHSKSAE